MGSAASSLASSVKRHRPTGGGGGGDGVSPDQAAIEAILFTSSFDSDDSIVLSPAAIEHDAMKSILTDAILCAMFKEYLNSQVAGGVIRFWLAVQAFSDEANTAAAADPADLQSTAAEIFSSFMAEGSTETFFPIDEETRRAVSESLVFDAETRQAKQSDTKILSNAFALSQKKAFQVMQFDFLPGFLGSTGFANCVQSNEAVMRLRQQGAEQPAERRRVRLEFRSDDESDGDPLLALLRTPLGAPFVDAYLQEKKATAAAELLDCLLEISHFEHEGDASVRGRRAAVILTRYGDGLCGEAAAGLVALKDNFEEQGAAPPQNLFADVATSISSALVREHLDGFNGSRFQQQLAGQLSDIFGTENVFELRLQRLQDLKESQRMNPLVKHQSRDDEGGGDDLPATATAVRDRETCQFCEVLANPLGFSLFKKFCMSTFCEELLQFHREASCFKEGNLAAPAEGTLIYDAELINNTRALRTTRAEHIIAKYIRVGSRRQLNISAALRQECIDSFERTQGAMPNLFDAVDAEIQKLLRGDLWTLFRNSNNFRLYSAAVEKTREREALRAASLRHASSTDDIL